ncbi:MAG: hypothetical protein QXL24_04215, partial [Candidatus Jordarchaeaceae archaeon]
GVITAKRRTASVTPTVIKASAGAIEYVPLVQVSNIASAIEELKKQGLLSKRDEEEIELRKRRLVAWQILKNDYIERHGKLSGEGDPIGLLTEKLYAMKTVSSILGKDQLAEEIRKMLEEGILNYTRDNGYVTWFWTNIGSQEKLQTVPRQNTK